MEIIRATYTVSSPSVEKCPQPDRPEYAFIGRSNVGKSSLINMLTQNEKLAHTSNSPGKTQLINHFNVKSKTATDGPEEQWYLVDLPGYGFAKRSRSLRNQWSQMTEKYIRERANLMQLFVLIDSRHSPQKLDLDFTRELFFWEIEFTIIFTKSDKENQRIVSANVKSFSEAILKQQAFLPRMIVTSSIKKRGRNSILELIGELNQEFYNPLP